MMGIARLDAGRLSGRDVMPGYRRSPYCPSIRGFTSTARLAFLMTEGPTLARGDVLHHPSLMGSS